MPCLDWQVTDPAAITGSITMGTGEASMDITATSTSPETVCLRGDIADSADPGWRRRGAGGPAELAWPMICASATVFPSRNGGSESDDGKQVVQIAVPRDLFGSVSENSYRQAVFMGPFVVELFASESFTRYPNQSGPAALRCRAAIEHGQATSAASGSTGRTHDGWLDRPLRLGWWPRFTGRAPQPEDCTSTFHDN